MGQMIFGPGSPEDYPQIEALLAAQGTPGKLRLSIQPDLAAGPGHPDALSHIVIGKYEGAVVATASCMTMPTPQGPVSWIGGLCVDPAHQRRDGIMRNGLDAIRAHLLGDQPDWQLAMVPMGNLSAKSLLTRKRENFPTFTPVIDYSVFAFRPRRADVPRVRAATQDDARPIAAYLSAQRRPLSPSIGEYEKFNEWRDLDISDFLVVEAADRISGVAALWDQRGARRCAVKSYGPRLGLMRPFLNMAAPLTQQPHLPGRGRKLNDICISFLTADTVGIACDLIRAGLSVAADRGLGLVTLGLAEDDPLHAIVAAEFPHRAFDCTLYGVTWPGGRALPKPAFFADSKVELALI